MKSGENWQVVIQKFKDLYDFIYVQSLRARADTTRGILIVTNKFYNFNHTM